MLQEQGRQRARSRSVCGLQPPCYPLTDAKLTAATSCPPEQSTDQGTLGRGRQTGESAAHPERLGERSCSLPPSRQCRKHHFPKPPSQSALVALTLTGNWDCSSPPVSCVTYPFLRQLTLLWQLLPERFLFRRTLPCSHPHLFSLLHKAERLKGWR